jgi:hypothetical protein
VLSVSSGVAKTMKFPLGRGGKIISEEWVLKSGGVSKLIENFETGCFLEK